MSVASSYGISLSEYYEMDSFEFAQIIKGKQAQERRWVDWMRLFVSRIMSPHVKGGRVSPEQVMQFKDEVDVSAEDQKQKLERMRKNHEKWDKAAKEGKLKYQVYKPK